MPQLNKAMAKKVSSAEGSFPVVPDGVYTAKLLAVKPSAQPGPSGSHYWGWEFELVDNDEFNGSHQFINTSLSEKALFKLNEIFAAFGVAPDTDTDELISHKVRLRVGHRTAQAGSRAGELVNDVTKVLPLDDSESDGSSEEIPF